MGDVVVHFSVQAHELLQDADDRLMQTIKGRIGFFDDDSPDEIEPIGSLEAHLFDICGAIVSNFSLFDLYDCHSRHLLDSLRLLYNDDADEFRIATLEKVGFEVEDLVEWHLNITRLDIEPQFRGERCGVRAMKLLRQYARRTGLIVTAKAHPEPRDETRAPSLAEVKKLRAYYTNEPSLGFKPIGRIIDGWLLANWSAA